MIPLNILLKGCLKMPQILNISVNKYLPILCRFIIIQTYNFIFEFLFTGLYYSSIEKGFFHFNFLFLLSLDLIRTFLRKYKILERGFYKVLSICKVNKEIT